MSALGAEFSVISGNVIEEIIRADIPGIVDLMIETYRAHAAKKTVNPPSQFLRFPDRENARIIALPAYLGGELPISGLKWIASYPDNIKRGMPRASAVLLLNDTDTGYPTACLEGSIISAARTAASAVAAAEWLCSRRRRADRLGFVGTGFIARYVRDFMIGMGWSVDGIAVFDLDERHAKKFAADISAAGWPQAELAPSAADVMRQSDLTVFTTTASSPYVTDVELLRHNPRVLHISLRDLGPELILAADNIVDDVDHCLTARTSPHLAETISGGRSFVTGTIADVFDGRVRPDPKRPVIFSPFGMGILDLALGRHVYREAMLAHRAHRIPNFFPN